MDHASLTVGIDGKLESAERLLGACGASIGEIHFAGDSHLVGSARTRVHFPDRREIRRIVDLAATHDVGVNIVMNGLCLGGRQLDPSYSRALLDYVAGLHDVGVDSLTVADPFLLHIVSQLAEHPDLVVSSVATVAEPRKARMYCEMGADRIILAPDVNRSPALIKKILAVSTAEIELVLNEGCLRECPWRLSHACSAAHITTDETLKSGHRAQENFHNSCCRAYRRGHPEEFFKSPWILPQHLEFYESMGVRWAKVASRNTPIDETIDICRAYIDRTFSGNVIWLLNTCRYLSDEFEITASDASEALSVITTCELECDGCDFCTNRVSVTSS